MHLVKVLMVVLVIGVVGIAAFVHFGVFNAAADVPHSPFIYSLMERVRQRSIAVRARDIQVPALDDPKLIAEGAEQYGAMCTGCHLAPGMVDSEIRPGLYPQPPNLSQPVDASPAEMFWTIKHGIKMSAMPSWGSTHDDRTIWGMVAFIKTLPGMTPEQYQALAKSTGKGESGHHHGERDAGASNADHRGHGESDQDRRHGNAVAGSGDEQSDAGETGQQHRDESGATVTDEHGKEIQPQAEPPLSLEGLKPAAVPDAEQVAVAFHNAMQNGDRGAVLALLSADVTVSESGRTQSRDEYARGHLGKDIEFMKKAQVKPISMASMPMGDAAMVGSESEIRDVANARPKVLRSRELLTLKRENGIWKILAIRWQHVPVDATDQATRAHGHK